MINIAEILKDCPKGIKLYSPLCGECYFDSLNMGTIICKKQNTQEITFTSGGYYMLPVFDDCECQLFPSKDQRDWSQFQRPFKDGDIVTWKDCGGGSLVACIYKERLDISFSHHIALYKGGLGIIVNGEIALTNDELRLATEEEKKKLFKAIKDNGYKWNHETKTLEKLIEPEFKIGNKVRHKTNHNVVFTIDGIEEDFYTCAGKMALCFSEQDSYELVPNKFDVTTLKTFDKVLVRRNKNNKWCGSFFSHIDDNLHYHCYNYVTIGGKSYPMCIPHEGNEHLCGTTDDCVEYYENW